MVSMSFNFCSHISLRLFSNFLFDFCPGDSSLFVILVSCFQSAWPTHFHRLYPISSPTGTWPVHFHTSLLVTPFVHLILRRRHWHASSKTWIRLVGLDACDAFQISHPDNKTKNTIINNKNIFRFVEDRSTDLNSQRFKEKPLKWKRYLYFLIIDYAKCFDRITENVLYTLSGLGVDVWMINRVRHLRPM